MEKSVGSGDGLLDWQVRRHAFKERRMLDVCGCRVPGIEDRCWGRELVPVSIASCDLAVDFLDIMQHETEDQIQLPPDSYD